MNKTNRRIKRRVITLLNREEMEFLHNMAMDSLFTTGHKLTKVDIIASLIDAAIKLCISAKGVKSRKELTQRIVHTAYNQLEKRRYPRIKKDLLVSFRPLESLGDHVFSMVEDLSLGGMRLDIPAQDKTLEIDQCIEIIIDDPHQEQEVKAIGKVIWIHKKEDGSFQAGIKLNYVRKEDRDMLIKYLNQEMDTKNEIE